MTARPAVVVGKFVLGNDTLDVLNPSTSELLDRTIRGSGEHVGAVLDIGQVLENEATQDRDMVLTYHWADSGDARVVNTPWKFDGVAPSVRLLPPHLGQHNGEVFAEHNRSHAGCQH